MTEASALTALLGPTNTGKTHRAIERMLEHESGMIGLPLRLLAREVYDRVSARVGESRVALVTGEEQRIPARPSYWIATVEAMPVEREVEFVAVDEIQLAAHDQRGHVFTSRILSARGTRETWLLGAGTMRDVLHKLAPTARQIEHPRLSRLAYAGTTPLSRVPPRSAVVAFSTSHVYEIAERIRARKGGAAVVLGALSPRTRNAQVAMFQAGEVDWLVATDAIGMGLNLDVDHVAFTALRKFDGREVRDVDEAELAQIAGRAGRWIQDGTFGTVAPLELPAGAASAIEEHRFAPVTRVRWRNDDLAFASVAALRESLHAPSPRPVLVKAAGAEDAAALDRLALSPEVMRIARGEEAVRLLWDVCTVPDFRKLLVEAHVAFLEELFLELARRGRLDDNFLGPRVRELDRDDGDVETLVARIAAVRTFTYVANRSAWLVSPARWQEETRALEDRLSDALHERLVARFVDAKKGRAQASARTRARRHASSSLASAAPGSAAVASAPGSSRRLVPGPGHPFAALASMKAALGGPVAAETAPRGTGAWVEAIVAARHADLELTATGRILHRETASEVGELVPGPTIARPEVKLTGEVLHLGAGAQRQIHRRLLAFTRDVVGDLLGDLRERALRPPARASLEAQAGVRGLVHRLELGLGTLLARDVADLRAVLDDEARAALTEAGLHLGGFVLYLPRGLVPAAIASRVALAAAWQASETRGRGRPGARLRAPAPGAVSFEAPRSGSSDTCLAFGYPIVARRAVRADILERVHANLREAEKMGRSAILEHAKDANATMDATATAATWMGCPRSEAARVLREMGSSPAGARHA